MGNKTNSSSNSNTVNAVNLSNSSTPTPNYTYRPSGSNSSSTGSSTPNYSSGSNSSSTPSYSNDSSNSSSSSVTSPSTDLGDKITNILPTNKFSDALPQLSSGKLGPMEISSNSVNYELFNVNNSTYGDYVQSLLDNGYVMSSDGSYIKGNYQVITTITQDGNMSIKLNII